MLWPPTSVSAAPRSCGHRGILGRILWRACVVGVLLSTGFAGWAAAEPPPPTRDRIRVADEPVAIYFQPHHRKVAERVGEICERAIPVIAAQLGLETVRPFAIHLIDDVRAREAEWGVRLPRWGIAFALMDNQLMLVDVGRATAGWNSLDRVIPHELSHLLVAQRVRGASLPVWFVEGLAMWQAGEWSLLEHWRLMEAVWTHQAPRLEAMLVAVPVEESTAREAYRMAYAGFTYRFDGEFDRLPEFLGLVSDTGNFSASFQRFFDEDEHEYYGRFASYVSHKYSSRLMLFQTGPLFSVVALLFLFVFLRIKLRNRRKMQRLEQIDRGVTWDE